MDFKMKSEEIVAVGEANRGMQKPEGAPKRVYDYWLYRTNSEKGRALREGTRRENFCHFWRVVAIWAPLFWLGKKIERVVDAKYTPHVFFTLVALAVVGIALGGGGLPGLLLLLGIGVAFVIAAGILAATAVYLESHPKVAKTVAKIVGGVVAVAALAFFLWLTGFVGLGIIAAVAVIAYLVRSNIERISDWVEARRAKAKAAEDARRAEKHRRDEEFYAEHGYYPWSDKAKKEPGRVSKFFTGVGDFVVMFANVVRVNKWKICPIMDIHDEIA